MLDALIQDTNASIKDFEVFLCIARDSELQKETIGRIFNKSRHLEAKKKEFISQGHEQAANILLGLQFVLDALSSEITMWLLLKAEEPEKAWDALIGAQEAAVAAARCAPGFAHLRFHHERLEAIERLVFPPQVFISSGLLADRQECTICSEDYEVCDHLVGMPYGGQMCQISLHGLRLDHAAITETPADKRCRITEFSDADGTRNRMTWRLTRGDGKTRAKLLTT